jgi:hypothetical protein
VLHNLLLDSDSRQKAVVESQRETKNTSRDFNCSVGAAFLQAPGDIQKLNPGMNDIVPGRAKVDRVATGAE